MGLRSVARWLVTVALTFSAGFSQPIEFESNGLKYQALTRNGLTIMVAELPSNVRDYSVVQVAVSNGGQAVYTVRPEDFIFSRADGTSAPAIPARRVVQELLQKASRTDVIRLVMAYETGLYGNRRNQSTNGYEARRQSALAEVGNAKLKAAATASALALVQTKLPPGQSTDGAIFYASEGKPLGTGVLRVAAAGATFEFPLLSSN